MFTPKQLGRQGEQLAKGYFQHRGYQIIGQNYRTRQGEIDLICQRQGIIRFVEVKTRSTKSYGWPEEAVNSAKLAKINLAAQAYLAEYHITQPWQIDVLSISINQQNHSGLIKHFKNITLNWEKGQ